MRIGDLARETGKTVRALRYYEEMGLLEPMDHTEGGFRLYLAEDVNRVRLIERLQELGFSLERIHGIMGVFNHVHTGQDVARKLQGPLETSLRDTRDRIQRLRHVERDIQEALRFLSVCQGCLEAPGRSRCTTCEQGHHQARLPLVMDALVR